MTDEQIEYLFDPRDGAMQGLDEMARRFARRIESAATAPLLERIAELEAKLAQQAEAQEPCAYLYHDAPSAEQASSLLSSTLIVLAADRRPTFRNETPLFTRPQPASEPMTDEQAAFENWLHKTSPSGDVTEVQRQWEASSEFFDLMDSQTAPVPLTWREASKLLSEHLYGEMTGDDYIIVKAVERHHGIGVAE